ncbi:MAG: hypothetical protein AAF215_22730 [Cyanobacteria bacterium P01_A01_bin.123]
MSPAVSHALTLHQVRLTLPESATPSQCQIQERRVRKALERIAVYPGLPPQAILIIRHLADPDPGQLLAANTWQGLRAWEQATQAALNQHWRTALRPAIAAVSANAASVWFEDPAEWLACLSWDVYQGVAGDRWWWHAVLCHYPHGMAREALFHQWQADPQWLPAALRLLYQSHPVEAVQLLGALPASQAEHLLDTVLPIYGVSIPVTPGAAPTDRHQTLVAALTPHLGIPQPSTIATLPLVTQALVAVCLTLPNTATLVSATRSPAAAADASPMPTETADAPPPTKLPVAPDRPVVTPASETVSSQESPAASPHSWPPGIPKIVSVHSEALGEVSSSSGDRSAAPPAVSSSGLSAIPPDESSDRPPESAPDRPIAPPLILSDTAIAMGELGIGTAIGGLWYLVNVLVDLDWPERSAVITPWHQVAALAQALLPDVPLDPVWEPLADIAGEPLPEALLSPWQAHILTQVRPYLTERLEYPDAIAHYLQEPATLYLTRTHVDVVFSLDQIRLDVRLAGLDRDPGWVPELARVIALHYE